MTEAITKTNAAPDAGAIERVLVTGDLAALTPPQRVEYYSRVCASLGLNPLTKPFAYITLNSKLVLYALRDCADQLRKIHSVSIVLDDSKMMGDVFLVKARATDATLRTDESTGAVSIKGLVGEALANALMKAETKAKRRVTLSICGLGMLDETEVETIRDARPGPPVDVPASPQRRSAPAPSPSLPAPSPTPPAPSASLPPEGRSLPPSTLSPVPAPVTPFDAPALDAEEVPPTRPEELFPDDVRPVVRVERAKMIKTGGQEPNTWTLYGFKFSDGVEATCFDHDFFRLACDALAANSGVLYQTSPGKKPGTLNLTDLTAA